MNTDSDDRTLVILIPPCGHSPGELVRLGFQIEAELDADACNHISSHDTPVEIGWPRTDAEMREVIAEAAIGDEWLAILRGKDGRVRAVAIGPVCVGESPVLAAVLASTREFGAPA